MCRRWDLPVAVIGRVTEEPDIVILTAPGGTGALDADGRPVAGATELARIPAAALASGAIVFQRESRAPTRRRAAPAPGAPVEPVDTLPLRGQDPGAVLLALLGSPNLSSRRTVFEQYDHNVQVEHRRRSRARCRRPPDQGHDQGARRLDRRQRAGWRHRPVARGRAVGRGGRAERRDHRRPAARRHELPQLRRSDEARGVLAADRGRPRPRGRLHRPRPARDRRQRLAVQRVAGSAIAPTPEIGVVGLLDDVAKRVGPAFRADGNEVLLVGQVGAGLAGSEYARLAGAGLDDGPPALDLAFEARLQAFIREAVDRGLVESCQDVSGGGLAVALAEMAMWGGRGARGPARRRRFPGGRPVRREPEPPGLRGRAAARARRSSCSRASTGCPATSSGPPAARGWSSSSPAKAPRAPPRSAGAGSPTRSTSPSTTCATRGTTGCHGRARRWRARARLMCGVVGVVLPDRGHEAAGVAATALFALQHRGQESAGIGVSDGRNLMIYKDLGMVSQVLDERRIPSLTGDLAVAHCRYSTTGLDGLGERPADAPARAASGARDRAQREPRQHPRAARASSTAGAAASPPAPTRSS